MMHNSVSERKHEAMFAEYTTKNAEGRCTAPENGEKPRTQFAWQFQEPLNR